MMRIFAQNLVLREIARISTDFFDFSAQKYFQVKFSQN